MADDDSVHDVKGSQFTSQTTLASALPDGCSYGEIPSKDGKPAERVIWVDFPPDSRENPFYFSWKRKLGITTCALLYSGFCSITASAFAIQVSAMCEELNCPKYAAEAGIGLYAWGAGIMPLFVAPFSEEFGRRPVYLLGIFAFWLFHMCSAVAQNTATALVARLMAGIAGSIGTSVVGGTIADIYTPVHRGMPMMLAGFVLYFTTGAGGTIFAFVTTRLQWRWVWWIQFIAIAVCLPLFVLVMKETRPTIILRRRAQELNKTRGDLRYVSHGEAEKVRFMAALQVSLTRPLLFLATEPIVIFFSLWVALAWSVMYVQVAGIPYMMRNLYGFDLEQVCLVYLTMCIGAVLGFFAGLVQDRVYTAKAPTRGVEARLYAPMVAGVGLALGCFITGFTALANVHWIASCIGQAIAVAATMTIYVTAFTYVSDCYGTYASSAIAGQSMSRNIIGGLLAFATTHMFRTMTARWALVMMGAFATILALVPFVAFIYGPKIRARSKYSRLLISKEHEALQTERYQREARGMDLTGLDEADE